ncbi:DDE-type integrase/transposase/recombinase [Streptomyces anulatus]|uniref:DDE-type integrase/transposase/recombinase n=1 Tax=Streptomyces anulatus TaxID=1892 RepID=UPI00398854E3
MGRRLTHVATWNGVVYVAFVVDTFSRRVVGWSAAASKETRLVLDAMEMARASRPSEQCSTEHSTTAAAARDAWRRAGVPTAA